MRDRESGEQSTLPVLVRREGKKCNKTSDFFTRFEIKETGFANYFQTDPKPIFLQSTCSKSSSRSSSFELIAQVLKIR